MASKHLKLNLALAIAAGLLFSGQAGIALSATTQQAAEDSSKVQPKPVPPTPPLAEDFEQQPQLSLFPRIGDYRPESDDETRLPFYNAYLEHLVRTAGVIKLAEGGRAFQLRSVASLDSVGFFSPIAVEPNRRYQISASFKTDLPAGGRAGIGILEFDQFLWIAEQYPRSLMEKHQSGLQKGFELTGGHDWTEETVTITTGPRTRMIHLVLYREGTQDRQPVLVDDIAVEMVE